MSTPRLPWSNKEKKKNKPSGASTTPSTANVAAAPPSPLAETQQANATAPPTTIRRNNTGDADGMMGATTPLPGMEKSTTAKQQQQSGTVNTASAAAQSTSTMTAASHSNPLRPPVVTSRPVQSSTIQGATATVGSTIMSAVLGEKNIPTSQLYHWIDFVTCAPLTALLTIPYISFSTSFKLIWTFVLSISSQRKVNAFLRFALLESNLESVPSVLFTILFLQWTFSMSMSYFGNMSIAGALSIYMLLQLLICAGFKDARWLRFAPPIYVISSMLFSSFFGDGFWATLLLSYLPLSIAFLVMAFLNLKHLSSQVADAAEAVVNANRRQTSMVSESFAADVGSPLPDLYLCSLSDLYDYMICITGLWRILQFSNMSRVMQSPELKNVVGRVASASPSSFVERLLSSIFIRLMVLVMLVSRAKLTSTFIAILDSFLSMMVPPFVRAMLPLTFRYHFALLQPQTDKQLVGFARYIGTSTIDDGVSAWVIYNAKQT